MVLIAELWAILIGVQIAWGKGFKKKLVESDFFFIRTSQRICPLTTVYKFIIKGLKDICTKNIIL